MLEPENECPSCSAWKSEDYELCRDCSESDREVSNEPIPFGYHSRVRETEKAVLFKLRPGFMGKSVWVPKSMLLRENAGTQTFEVPIWWAEQEGLEE